MRGRRPTRASGRLPPRPLRRHRSLRATRRRPQYGLTAELIGALVTALRGNEAALESVLAEPERALSGHEGGPLVRRTRARPRQFCDDAPQVLSTNYSRSRSCAGCCPAMPGRQRSEPSGCTDEGGLSRDRGSIVAVKFRRRAIGSSSGPPFMARSARSGSATLIRVCFVSAERRHQGADQLSGKTVLRLRRVARETGCLLSGRGGSRPLAAWVAAHA